MACRIFFFLESLERPVDEFAGCCTAIAACMGRRRRGAACHGAVHLYLATVAVAELKIQEAQLFTGQMRLKT